MMDSHHHSVNAFRCLTRWIPSLHNHAIDSVYSDAITRAGCRKVYPHNPERLFYSPQGWCCGIAPQEGKVGQSQLVTACAAALDRSHAQATHEDPYLCNCGAPGLVCQPGPPA